MFNRGLLSQIYYRGGQGYSDFLTSEGDELFFDENRVYGYSEDEIYAAGDFSVDLTGADSSKTVLIYHKDNVKPTFSAGVSVTESGEYVPGALHKIRVRYTGSAINVGYHNQL